MKLERISGAIFDMDGTLLDSMFIWDGFAERLLTSHGIVPHTGLGEEIATLTIAEVAEYLVCRYPLGVSASDALWEMERLASALYDTVRPKEGVTDLLATLHGAGVPMAVATLTERHDVERTLARLGLLPYFTCVLTCAEVGADKRSPAIYEAALAALGTKKEETPVFEDASYALATARRAGFPTVAVYDHSEPRFEVAAALATLTVIDYRDMTLLPLIRRD